MIQNEDVAVVKDEKDSSIVIMKKSDHAVKLCTMTDFFFFFLSGTTDNTLK